MLKLKTATCFAIIYAKSLLKLLVFQLSLACLSRVTSKLCDYSDTTLQIVLSLQSALPVDKCLLDSYSRVMQQPFLQLQ
jgi:hypothetical protein